VVRLCITAVRVGLRVTGCIDWLAINGPSVAIDPLRAQIKAGMYTLTYLHPFPFGFAGRLLISHFVFVVVIFGDTLRRVWVTIGAVEMACTPANGGTYVLCSRGRNDRLTKVHCYQIAAATLS
jgi:hypothetical protein